MTGVPTGARLARLADPAGINDLWRPPPITATAAAACEAFVAEASAHNVVPAVTRNLAAELKSRPASLVAGKGEAAEAVRRNLMARIQEANLALVGRNMLLAGLARQILDAASAAGVPVVLLKGLDFAENCYGSLAMRAFSDIDLLVPPDAAPEIAGILAGIGFAPVTPSEKRIDYTERQFTRSDPNLGSLLVEVHTDLAHAPKLRQRISLTYETYSGSASGGVTMAARLILAAVHGALSHLFDRLQYLTDILVIARHGVHADELRERVHETGSLVAVATGLDLVIRDFGCPECRRLADALPAMRHGWLARALMTPAMVNNAQGPLRMRSSWRRQAYRVLMTR